MKHRRSPRPSWRLPEGRAARPELWLVAAACLSLLLVEVWQSSRLAQLSFTLGQDRTALTRARARLDFVRAELERRTTRAELAPIASELGLAPLDARQIVRLPSEYLADGEPAPRAGERPAPLVAWAERASRALVPEARAKTRAEN